ncbi:MAG TPA: histidinol-phosphatase [Candidatus Limnocylindria bacterium]|nr:histidinol-phosphatase [Candidatus Limnocylindria bacterium]
MGRALLIDCDRLRRPHKEDFTIRTTFHTHTSRCMHAEGADEAYVLAALESGFSHIGFSDHTPWPYRDGFVSRMRMTVSELDDYVRSVAALRGEYAGKIEVSLGLEAEYVPEFRGWLAETRERLALDYLILGNHYEGPDERVYYGTVTGPELVRRYADGTIRGLQSGLYDCLAHPDLFLLNYPRFDAECRAAAHDISAAARGMGVPMEFNTSGLGHPAKSGRGLGYPCLEFWQVAAQEGVSAIIGVDAHRPERMRETAVYDLSVQHLRALGIPRIETLMGDKEKLESIA